METTINNELSASNICIPKVYSPIFEEEHIRYFCLSSGRISGKTCILVAMWWICINKYPNRDVVILQATATEIKDSIINEIEKFLKNSGFDVGELPSNEWYIPKSKEYIKRLGQDGTTYFFPITDSKGGQRSRGINTKNKLSLVLYEEAQKNKDRNVLDQSIITFIRQLDKDAKLVVVGNNETLGHWFVDFVEEKKVDEEWKYIYANCYDIWGLLNDQTKSFIDNYKNNNPIEFRRVFLGDIHASNSDVVFPQFNQEKHYKKAKDIEQHYISNLVIGVDHATANDTFAIVPVAILDNGKTQTLEICYDDPQETNVTLAPTEQCDILEHFLTFLDDKYGIASNHLNTILSVDGQSSHFIKQLEHLKKTSKKKELWKFVKIKGFTLKKKDINLGIIKNAFAFNVLTILDEGYFNWQHKQNTHRLKREIQAQRYKNGKLDPKIPNDLCDALEYGLVPYYSNCYNMSFPIRKAIADAHYNDIKKMANFK